MPRGRRLAVLRGGRLALVRWLLVCAIAAIAAAALLAVHVIPSPGAPASLSAHLIHKLQHQREIGSFHAEMRWTQELSPPQLSKLLLRVDKKFQDASLNASTKASADYDKLWKPPSGKNYERCVDPTPAYSPPGMSRGYLLVHTNGGLNQMRAGISDMVAVARIINATLVIPELDKASFWQDSSNFSDVFDEKHFINYLSNDVKIVKKLPKELKKVHKAVRHFRSWSGVDYYKKEISYLWADHKVIRAAKSDSRLANNNLPPDIQKLRCRTFYEALRFAPHIEAMGKLLVQRMRSYGPYIALHLRYEKDMLAFSGCTFGLSPTQTDELTRIRENTTHWKVKEIDPIEQRSKGYCPLTPKEVALFLSSLGYPSTTPIYIAAGEIYGGDFHMADLEARFPLIMNKAKLASVEELEPFSQYSSQLAALDYIVSVESDVFIPSYSGNMARAVEGHRRFLGHRKTISPDRKALVRLFDKLEKGRIEEGMKLSEAVVEIHRKRQGSPRKRKGPVSGTRGRERFRSEEAFYENPLPDCLCRRDSIGRGLML